MKELVIKKCLKCGALVEVIQDCTCDNCGIQCCGEEMKIIKSNSVDASFEKHVPQYEIKGDMIEVKVNHIMEEEHYIEWIAFVDDKRVGKKFLVPNEDAIVEFPYIKNSTIYAYCNKHGLWKNEVK